MIGFCLANMNNAAVATYTVNIIKKLGGTDTILGFANFVSAASEMPVMLLFGYFMKKRELYPFIENQCIILCDKTIDFSERRDFAHGISGTGITGCLLECLHQRRSIL